ncbi:hypothetical protein Tco_1137417 [Tanacetum coccineum]
MYFEQIKDAFNPVWKSIQDFVPMDSKLEKERFKRLGIQLEQRSSKRLKDSKSSRSDFTDEDLKIMMELVHIDEVYVEALQETHKSGLLIDDKEKQLWVELQRLYELDIKDQLWALQRYMHDPL